MPDGRLPSGFLQARFGTWARDDPSSKPTIRND
jgi:hypothetical protein